MHHATCVLLKVWNVDQKCGDWNGRYEQLSVIRIERPFGPRDEILHDDIACWSGFRTAGSLVFHEEDHQKVCTPAKLCRLVNDDG
jgi:hypothetical protein